MREDVVTMEAMLTEAEVTVVVDKEVELRDADQMEVAAPEEGVTDAAAAVVAQWAEAARVGARLARG